MPFRARLPSWAGQCQTHTLCTYSITSRESFVHSFAAHKSDKWLACHFLLPTARDHAKAYLQESDVYLPAYCLLLSHAKPTHESLIYAPAASCLIRPCKASLQGGLCLLACRFLLTAYDYLPATSCLLLSHAKPTHESLTSTHLPLLAYCWPCNASLQGGLWLLARRLMKTSKEAYDFFQGGLWLLARRLMTTCKEAYDCLQGGLWLIPRRLVTTCKEAYDCF